MLWINFIHLYQPANADAHTIKEATELSYQRLISALEEHPEIKFTINIAGCLLLRWEKLGYGELIKRIGRLIKDGRIELTGSAAYHPLMPLVPAEEAQRQIRANEKILQKYFGKDFHPAGFFLPEMAHSRKIAKIVKKAGYEWLILDEISCNGQLDKVDFHNGYTDVASGLKVVFRSRALSKSYVPDTLWRIIKEKKENGRIFITATDGELYGLRHNDPSSEFEKLLKYGNLKTLTVSEFINSRTDQEKIKLVPCNWESTEADLKNNLPYALWFDKKNIIQKKLWQLAKLAYKTIERHKEDDNYYWARWHLERGLASCTFWWASGKDFRLFGPISWNPDEIERGTNELIRSVRALEDAATRKTKIKAEKLYIKIKQMVWQKHWAYYWKK